MQFQLHSLSFDNTFAYGEGNSLALDEERVTQIIGANGSGKSSIPNVLEELFYNKNSRGIKKASIVNRKAASYSMSAEFSIGTSAYTISKVVKSSAKVILTKDGKDISGHTATQTYKVLEQEIGLDFPTFSKLVYQSMKSSLDFLSATDTNRKKFLIGLLGLEKYAEVEDKLKKVAAQHSSKLSEIEGSLSSVKGWMSKNSNIPEYVELLDVPEADTDSIDELAALQYEESQAASKNQQISQAVSRVALAKRKADTASADFSIVEEPTPVPSVAIEINKAKSDLSVVNSKMTVEKGKYQTFKAKAENTACPTCGTALDVSSQERARDIAKELWLGLQPERDLLQGKLAELEEQQKDFTMYTKNAQNYKKVKEAHEAANAYLDQVLLDNSEVAALEEVSVDSLRVQIENVKTLVQNRRKIILDAEEHNKKANTTNAKRELVTSQLQDRREELDRLEIQYKEIVDLVTDYKTLVKAFGAKGLVAYKIESSIKSLEEILNQYLSRLTAGRFAIGFELSGAKLDVVVYDDSELVEVNSLSSGEFANVQVATLLAIRSILSTLNSVSINVLFLDEVISVIDGLGRDRLIELLLEETGLNTLLVSHEYSHPLASKLHILKEEGFSCIKKEL